MARIAATESIGKTVWFATIKDTDVAFSVLDSQGGTATQIQVVPAPSRRVIIARRSFFIKSLISSELSALRKGKNFLTIPYSDENPIVAGAPTEQEVYFIDRKQMRVRVVIY